MKKFYVVTFEQITIDGVSTIVECEIGGFKDEREAEAFALVNNGEVRSEALSIDY